MVGLCKRKALLRSIARGPRAATGYDQGRPSIENDSAFHGETISAVACFGSTRLSFGEAGQDGGAARNDMLREDGRKIVQGALEQVGEHEVGLHAVEEGMRKSSRLKHADEGPDAVLPRIVGCDRHRERIAVACRHASPERLGGGDGEDAGTGADIDDDARAAALELLVERQETAECAGMMRRAESLAGVDLNGKTTARQPAPVVTAM